MSITSVICKMESILFANEHHGFVPNRDCMTNLLLALENWCEALEFGYDNLPPICESF